MEPTKKIHPGIAALIVIVLVGIVATAVIVIATNQDKQDTATESTTSSTSSDPLEVTPAASTGTYEDGTYSATGSYSTPGGRESIELTVTITDGVITSTSLVENAGGGEAKAYQDDFAAGYKTLVVGKSVDEVSLSRVSGSSLTSNGFNDALDQIKSDAQA